LGGEAVELPVGAEQSYQLNRELIARHWASDTAAVMIASPSNPTGTLADPTELDAIAAYVRERGAGLIVDEIYRGLVYGESPPSALRHNPDAFVINSFSKYFGMTGWRLGWLVTPPGYEREAEKLAQNLFLAPPTPAQYAALAAFTPATLEILESRRQAFQERRDFLIPALRELGFGLPVMPQGAFYAYAHCGAITDDSFRFAWRALEEGGVAITPGVDFGPSQGNHHLRFAYTTAVQRLEMGVARLHRLIADS
jgi:aspartate/methionine/tyrosine aminotransferase